MLTNLIDTYKKNLDDLNNLSKDELGKPEVKSYIKLLKKVIKDLNGVQDSIGQVPKQASSDKTKADYNKMISGYGFYYGGNTIPAQYSDTDNQTDSGSGSDANAMGETYNSFGNIDWTDPNSINVFFENKPHTIINSKKPIQQSTVQQPTSFIAEDIMRDINQYRIMLDSEPDDIEQPIVQQTPIQQPTIQQNPIQQPIPQQVIDGDAPLMFNPDMWTKADAIKDIMVTPIQNNMNTVKIADANIVLSALSKNSNPVKIEQSSEVVSDLARMLQQAQLDAQKYVGAKQEYVGAKQE